MSFGSDVNRTTVLQTRHRRYCYFYGLTWAVCAKSHFNYDAIDIFVFTVVLVFTFLYVNEA